MVFSSIPVYLDPPNWHQQHNQQSGDAGENLLLPPLPPPSGGGSGGSGGGSGGMRPGSMSERARQAKIPQPETALKCPRCDSTNTKFCYFNNYSLTQPRHFCKTCRRYWTRGGSLRNVPVGGGCRRNKRSIKGSNRSKSPSKAAGGGSCSTSTTTGLVSSSCNNNDILGNNMLPPPQALQHIPILPPLHHLNDFNSTGMGLNFSGIHPPAGGVGMEFQIGSSTNSSGSFLSSGLVDQLRFQQVHQQFPNFLANLETQNGLYNSYDIGEAHQNYGSSKPMDSMVTQLATFKMEENNRQQGLNLSKNFLGISGNDQYWSGNNAAFTDLTGFTSSSSTTNLL